MAMTMEHQMTEEMRQCISNCLNCHALCLETSQHCLTMGGKHAEANHIRTMQDCAQACSTSADFMLRMSPHHKDYCRACASLCKECGDECERLSEGNDLMKRCAEACRQCEQSCRQMAA